MQYGLNVKTEPFEFAAGPFESYLEMEDENYKPDCSLASDLLNGLTSRATAFKNNRSQKNRDDLLALINAGIGVLRGGEGRVKDCTRRDLKLLRDGAVKLRPGLPENITYRLNQMIYWARKAGERAARELEWESEEETINRGLPVRFRANFNVFLSESARGIGRWTVYRSDQGRRALQHARANERVLRAIHNDLRRQGVSEGSTVELIADFQYEGQGASRRVTGVKIYGYELNGVPVLFGG